MRFEIWRRFRLGQGLFPIFFSSWHCNFIHGANSQMHIFFIILHKLYLTFFIWVARSGPLLFSWPSKICISQYCYEIDASNQVSTFHLLSPSSAFHLLSTKENRWSRALKKLNWWDPVVVRFEPWTSQSNTWWIRSQDISEICNSNKLLFFCF